MSSSPFVVVIFITRKPTLSPEEFKDHWENRHVPLLKSLAGARFPLSHRRHYLSRDPSAPDYPLRVLVGQLKDFDFDAFTVVTFESETAFKEFVPTMTRPEVLKDEDRFTVREKMKAVIVGEVNVATRE